MRDDRFDFDSSKEVMANLGFLDAVLESLGARPILTNSDFSINDELSAPYWISFKAKSTTNPLASEFYIEISKDGVRLDVNGIPEIFEWTTSQIGSTPEKLKQLLIALFSGYVVIESRGRSRFVQVFNRDGEFVQSVSFNNLLHMITKRFLWRHDDRHHLFTPFYPQ